MHTSEHKCVVIHSGLYYKPGLLEARNCAEGDRGLLVFCKRKLIPREICIKIVVATC